MWGRRCWAVSAEILDSGLDVLGMEEVWLHCLVALLSLLFSLKLTFY